MHALGNFFTKEKSRGCPMVNIASKTFAWAPNIFLFKPNPPSHYDSRSSLVIIYLIN
jgi:hypothetical protein